MSAAKARFDCSTVPEPSSVTTPLGMVSTIVSSSRRRSSIAWLAAVSCAEELSARLAAGLKIRCHVIEGFYQVAHLAGGDGMETRWSYLPAAISSMATPSASTGRVICLERNMASHRLEKKMNTVMSNCSMKKMVRMLLRARNSAQ